MAYRALTDTDLAAIQAFAAVHGRTWKSALTQTYWYNARLWKDGPDPEMGSVLHGLRNSHGANWLGNFKLPKKA